MECIGALIDAHSRCSASGAGWPPASYLQPQLMRTSVGCVLGAKLLRSYLALVSGQVFLDSFKTKGKSCNSLEAGRSSRVFGQGLEVGMKEDQQASMDLQMGREGFRNGADLQAENYEMKPFEDNPVSDSSRDNFESTMNTQPPPRSKARADGHAGDANPVRARDDAAANLHSGADNFSERKKKRLLKKITRVHKDGALSLDFDEDSDLAASLCGSEAQERPGDDYTENEETESVDKIPPLRIVMLIVGTRGDVQPFLAIGKKMQEYGHRVRLATHENFKDFVQSGGLEFFPLGGDSKVLADFMVKNRGFVTVKGYKARKQIKSVVYSLLEPCTEPAEGSDEPFNAQVIIANPPTYGHVDVAEYLKVPLHICFTMPWTPTSAFPHPLSRIGKAAGYKLSYQVVNTTVWLGISTIINGFRSKKLKLRKKPYFSSHGALTNNSPTSYLWSPHLVPKPDDWGPLIDVVGFCTLEQASEYKPPEDLVKWLKAGPKPIYVGFGSLPIEDPRGTTKKIVEALRQTNQRAVISQGSVGLGKQEEHHDFLYLVQECPHDWLFPQCAAVVHHGGAGTVAAGLKAACPTTVVPFFGDQPFWGSRIHDKGIGPEPIPIGKLSARTLVDAIKFMLKPEVKDKAVELSKAMDGEDGVQGAVDSFHKHIRKRVPEIMRERPPASPPHRTKGEKLDSLCTPCWTRHRSPSQK